MREDPPGIHPGVDGLRPSAGYTSPQHMCIPFPFSSTMRQSQPVSYDQQQDIWTVFRYAVE